MSDEDEDEDDGDGEDEDEDGEGGGGRSFSAKKIGLFVGLPVLLLVGGGAAAFFFGLLDPLFGGGEDAEEHVEEEVIPREEVVFIELPEMLINLNNTGNQVSFLKLSVSLEVKDPELALHIEELMPRVIDNFQVFLRELRVEDLTGARGTFRIKEELLARVNAAVAPARIEDVLFREILVQ